MSVSKPIKKSKKKVKKVATETISSAKLKEIKKVYDGRFDDCSAAVFVVLPPDGRIVSVNTEAEELTAYEKRELEAMVLADIFRDEDRSRIASIFDSSASFDFRKLFEHNVIVRKRSKRKIFVDMGFKRASLAGHNAIIFTLQDITDLKNNEERVLLANSYINNIINSIIEILLVIDSNGLIQSANSAALTLLGYAEQEVIGRPFTMLFPDLEKSDATSQLSTVNDLSETETVVRTRDAHFLPVLISKSPLKQVRGDEGPRTVIVAMDISERKKAERLIGEQQTMIVQASKMSALGEMASSIAHEINNPLHILLGHAELLALSLEQAAIKQPSILQGLNQIEFMGQRIQKIVRGLQALARDQRQDAMETASLEQIINDTLSFCEQRIRLNVGNLIVPTFAEDISITCRPTQISQVLLNLLNNSYDAITTSADPKQNSWIKIDVNRKGKEVLIAVSDSGQGIPRATVERLFTPFFTTKPVGKGTGIGLSVSKALIEAHGGTLRYDTTSENTRFVIALPAAQEAIVDAAS